MADSQARDALDCVFVGLMPDSTPPIRTRVFTGNIYCADLR